MDITAAAIIGALTVFVLWLVKTISEKLVGKLVDWFWSKYLG